MQLRPYAATIRWACFAAALALPVAAWAQQPPQQPPPPPTDLQLAEARALKFQGDANLYLLSAQSLQAKLGQVTALLAARDRWWADWWKGAYPGTPAPAAPAEPKKAK